MYSLKDLKLQLKKFGSITESGKLIIAGSGRTEQFIQKRTFQVNKKIMFAMFEMLEKEIIKITIIPNREERVQF